VTVSVAVKNGNVPVAGLGRADFQLFDNGVLQEIDDVRVAQVPIDLSLFMDTSGSTSGVQGTMREDVRRIVGMLRPDDRFRLLTIGLSVQETIPWSPAGAAVDINVRPVGGISLVYDAIATALLHPIDTGRRHLIVALTDGSDCGSIVKPDMVIQMAARSEAVLYWIVMRGVATNVSVAATCDMVDGPGPEAVEASARQTGGEVRSAIFGSPDVVKEFGKILEDFKTSYILTFRPKEVPATGWHTLRVEVPKTKYQVRARPGYFRGN
jgi:VWFA-related protein